MIGEFGVEYELFKGDIWTSKQDFNKDIQGTNVAHLQNDGTLRVLSYVIRKGNEEDNNLKVEVWNTLKSYGWYDEVCNRMMGVE